MRLATNQKVAYDNWRQQQGHLDKKKIDEAIEYFKINGIHVVSQTTSKIVVLKKSTGMEYTYDTLSDSWQAHNRSTHGVGIENLARICTRESVR